MRLGSVNYETKGKIAILTLDEPAKLNALSPGIREGIVEGLKQIAIEMLARVREQARVDERDRRRRAFDVEQDDADGSGRLTHAGRPGRANGMNIGPKQTG